MVTNDGRLVGVYHSVLLPGHRVFDKNRCFRVGNHRPALSISAVGIGITLDK
ncbi:hypothetical protein ACFLUP_02585 [Chloroflexota bacterium]